MYMGKTFIRIDDRLIHGQIAVAWAQTLSIGEIVAFDDQTANNVMLQKIMLAGISKDYHPKILSFEQAEESLSHHINVNRLVIVRSPKHLPKIMSYIKELDTLYLGNIQKTADAKYNLSSGAGGVLFFSPEDIDIIEGYYQEGVNVLLQMVPSAGARTWTHAKKKFKKN
jgi:mannose/fructose/N-acetylgalactosamine-specific phosphotransferase system component IIB